MTTLPHLLNNRFERSSAISFTGYFLTNINGLNLQINLKNYKLLSLLQEQYEAQNMYLIRSIGNQSLHFDLIKEILRRCH